MTLANKQVAEPTIARDYQFSNPWDIVAATIKAAGIHCVFGLPGDDMQATGAMNRAGLQVQWCRDQRMAAHMAAGYALTTGQPGVCILGRGPGLAAAIPALLESHTGGFPVVVIAGGYPAKNVGKPGFQLAPQLQMVAPVTKNAIRMENCEQLRHELTRSLDLSMAVPAGPVYVEIPDDLTLDSLDSSVVTPCPAVLERLETSEYEFEPALPSVISAAKRPVILVGGGARGAVAGRLEALSEYLGAPILVTASGRGSVEETHPNFCGLSGLYLAEEYRSILTKADIVVALGSRLEETAIMHLPASVTVYQVNLEPNHFSYHFGGHLHRADLHYVVQKWTGQDRPDQVAPPPSNWLSEWHLAKETRRKSTLSDPIATSKIPYVLGLLKDRLPDGSIVCHENGLMDIWSYLYPIFVLPPGATAVVPSEQTTLGFGLAAAVGASLGNPDTFVVAIGGDGAYNLLSVEQATIAESSAAVLFIILDNAGYGWLEHMNRDVNGLRGTFATGFQSPTKLENPIRTFWIHEASQALQILEQAVALVSSGRTVVVRVACTVEQGPTLADEL